MTRTGSASAGYYAGLDLAWAYDNFGNRESQTPSGTSGVSLTQPGPLTFTAGNNRAAQFSYDSAGHVQTDFSNSYLYDAEGRICAVNSTVQGVTLYLYDAEGRRVGRGSGSFSCNPSSNGFALTHRYVLDLSGAQVTELDGSGNWLHTNAFANGTLLATYSASGTPLSFALNDWVGTKRVQAKADGERDTTFLSLPFGDQLVTGTGSTEQFYTGQQRDSESGNDYFNARYYASAVGRFLSPDPSQLYYADPTNPQSFNLYSYALNNPLKNTDQSGLYCTYFKSDFGNYNDVESVDDSGQYDSSKYSSAYDECASNGGQWTEVSSVEVNADDSNDNLSTTSDTSNVQVTPGQDSKSTVVDCVGIGRGLKGVSGPFPKKGGAYNYGKNPVQVTAGTAAVIPSQFHFQNNVAMKPFVGEISGAVGTNSFSSVTDSIDNKQSPIPGMSTPDAFQKLNPGKLIVEVAGAPKDVGANALVNVVVPQGVGCPANTSEAQ